MSDWGKMPEMKRIILGSFYQLFIVTFGVLLFDHDDVLTVCEGKSGPLQVQYGGEVLISETMRCWKEKQ